MRKIVSFDFDKTLFDHSTMRIPDSALHALEKLRENGTLIVLATGRDMDNYYSRPYLDWIRPDARIDQNGTKIVADGRIIFEHFMDRGLLDRLLSYAEEHGVGFGATIGDLDYYVHPERVEEAEMRRFGVCGRKFVDAGKLLGMKVRTVAFIGTEKEALEMERHFPEISLRMFSINYGADVIEKGFSKAEGLIRLCDYYKVPLSETYAFGDSGNDTEIIEAANVGIAMGNGRPELKEKADYVTDPIDADGVWNALVHFGLISGETKKAGAAERA